MNVQNLSALSTLYGEKHRHYHNLNHIHSCLAEYEKYKKDVPTNPTIDNIVKTSIWWHDSIYNPYSSENELESANLFFESLKQDEKRWYFNDVIKTIILATAKHTEDQDLSSLSELSKSCTEIVLDLDLSSMAASTEIFDKNSDDIRKEFHFVPDEVFLVNRIKFLQSMLARKRIYYTDYFFNKYEEKARINLSKGISRTQWMLDELRGVSEQIFV